MTRNRLAASRRSNCNRLEKVNQIRSTNDNLDIFHRLNNGGEITVFVCLYKKKAATFFRGSFYKVLNGVSSRIFLNPNAPNIPSPLSISQAASGKGTTAV